MKTFLELLIGTEGIAPAIAFTFFALFGMFFIKLARYNRKKQAGLRATPPVFIKFNYKLWLEDNLLDFILAFMGAFGFYRFFPDALNYLGSALNLPVLADKMAYGLLVGLLFQYLFHKLLNKVKINVECD